MNDKDLLFVLANGEEYIKARYITNENQIKYFSHDENVLFDNLKEFEESILYIYEENKIEMSLLIEEIKTDHMIHEKIKNNPKNKLMFRYENEKFNKYIEDMQ